MSVVALAGGILYYAYRGPIFALHERYGIEIASPVAFERVFRDAVKLSRAVMGAVDNLSLQHYAGLLVATALGLGAYAFFTAPPSPLRGPLAGTPIDLAAIVAFAALAVGSVGAAVHHRKRFLAIIFLSVVGLVVSLTFVRFSAPDLALTQLSVEVVTIVLLLLALRFLPAEVRARDSWFRRARDIGIATLSGLATAGLTYAMLTRPFETISGYFLTNSIPGGGGANVVNVILVDFRGFDTLGEIAVLALAALGAQALLAGLKLRPHANSTSVEADRHPIMLAMLMRPLLPLALTVSVYILLRGHNLPGGGFIAGLITGVALILQYLAVGIDFARERLPLNTAILFALGLTLAAGTGAGAMLFGAPFLTSAHGYVYPPVIGKTELATALIFDLGVYLVVVATVLLILSELGALSRREVRPASKQKQKVKN